MEKSGGRREGEKNRGKNREVKTGKFCACKSTQFQKGQGRRETKEGGGGGGGGGNGTGGEAYPPVHLLRYASGPASPFLWGYPYIWGYPYK